MRRRFTRLAALALAVALLSGAELDPAEYLDYIKFLASPRLKGRGDGTPELDKAAAYIAARFRAFGLKPLHGHSYYQDFELTTSARLGTHSRMRLNGGARAIDLRLEQDFVPLNLSAAGPVKGQVVFVGYGITAPEYNYDDYAGVDVKDKIVLILRHEPQEHDDKSVFEGKSYTSHSQLFSKAANAKMHGARAAVLIDDSPSHPGDGDKLEKFGTTAGPGNAGIGFVEITWDAAAAWLKDAGKDLPEILEGIDKDLHPRSFALPAAFHAEAKIDIDRSLKKVHNVVGYWPGETSEYVIVGAHYDHLGLGEQFSLAPSMAGTVHPGADDNASGTAGVLELAHVFGGKKKQKRGILFLSFAGEELGLLGSNYYANHPELPIESAVAMINMDMIGRIRDHKVYVGGSGTGSTLTGILKEALAGRSIQTDMTETAGYGSSDHTSFTAKQVPILFFFSGLHADYHRPSDTWDKIDAPASVDLLGYIADVVDRLENAATRPLFVRVAEPDSAHAGTPSAGSASGYGPDFGSIPDFTELPNGVRFADIRPGSPAAKAGLKGGDILINFDGKPIQNLYDFTYALRAKKPGQEVVVKVLRAGQPVEVKVLLTARK